MNPQHNISPGKLLQYEITIAACLLARREKEIYSCYPKHIQTPILRIKNKQTKQNKKPYLILRGAPRKY